jgi:hypothetical protein
MPAIIPEKSGAPDAKAIPKHKGTATKNTTILDDKFCLTSLNTLFICLIILNRIQ